MDNDKQQDVTMRVGKIIEDYLRAVDDKMGYILQIVSPDGHVSVTHNIMDNHVAAEIIHDTGKSMLDNPDGYKYAKVPQNDG